MCLCAGMLTLEWKEWGFTEKVNSRWFCWSPAAILMYQKRPPIWRLHTKVYKRAWDVSQITQKLCATKTWHLRELFIYEYLITFHLLSFSALDGFQFIFFCALFIAWKWKRSNILQNLRSKTEVWVLWNWRIKKITIVFPHVRSCVFLETRKCLLKVSEILGYEIERSHSRG